MQRTRVISTGFAILSSVIACLTLFVGSPRMRAPLRADGYVCARGSSKLCEIDYDCDHWDGNGDCTHFQEDWFRYQAEM
ncbi:MAG: hypothetical protein JWM95_2815 [Gemmatimonadetes bacterium]|nr:hypothetical protein [Gemmatimonadota bacterium]